MAKMAYPLYGLLKKDRPSYWSSSCEESVQQLKDTLVNLPELAYPDPNVSYELHCGDSSSFDMGSCSCPRWKTNRIC